MNNNKISAAVRGGVAAVCFAVPLLLYFLIRKAILPGGAVFYSVNGAIWIFAAVAAIAAYTAMAPKPEQDCIDREESRNEDLPSESAEAAYRGEEQYIEEYAELYVSREQSHQESSDTNESLNESVKTGVCGEDIVKAIRSQTVKDADFSENTDPQDDTDDIWRDFFKASQEDEGEGGTDGIYDHIPDTLPEGYSYTEMQDTDDETVDQRYCKDTADTAPEATQTHIGNVIRIVAAVVCAVAVGMGAMLAGVYCAADESGVVSHGVLSERKYEWADVSEIRISPEALGHGIVLDAVMTDGSEYRIYDSTVIRGQNASFADMTDIEVCELICRTAAECGAKKTVADRKAIEAYYNGTNDFQAVRRMIGTADTEN